MKKHSRKCGFGCGYDAHRKEEERDRTGEYAHHCTTGTQPLLPQHAPTLPHPLITKGQEKTTTVRAPFPGGRCRMTPINDLIGRFLMIIQLCD